MKARRGREAPGDVERNMVSAVSEGFELRHESTPLIPLLRQLVQSLSLIRILARKDFYVRYRRASFGLLWAIGLPLVQATVLAFVLSRITRLHAPIAQAVFIYSGILPWNTFSTGLQSGTNSIVDNTAVATRIYFPRAVFPIVVVLSGFYGLIPGVVVLVVMHLVLGGSVGPEIVLLLPAIGLCFMLTTAFALVLSALQVYFRDIKHILAAITLPWFWASGVFFQPESLGKVGRWFKWDPAVGMIQLFRAALGAGGRDWVAAVWIAVGWSVGLTVIAVLVHRRYDRVFVDLL
jgi:lipopolysaccharide transport system permease protein